MIIEKKSYKSVLVICLGLLLIISLLNLVVSQETKNSEQPLKEEETKAGTSPTQTEGKIQDTNLNGKDGEKQDIGGLANLPSDSESSLKGKNLDFKKETEPDGTKKLELTENNNLGGESKLELNGNEFSNKDSTNELGKSKFVIEKKENEKYAETGIGTKYQVTGGENGKENAVDELAGREIELSKDTKVEIKEGENGNKLVDIEVPEGGTINSPGERKNGEEEEGKETDYKWNGLNLKWLDQNNLEHTVNGELFWNQKNGFYLPGGKSSSIDGVNIFSESSNGNKFETQIFTDGKLHPEATGSYASFGKDTLVTGSNNQNPGAILGFQKNNKYGVNIDQESDYVAMQANSKGQISLTNRNSQGLSPLVTLSGNGGVLNNGNHYYSSNGNRFDTNSINRNDLTSSPIEITATGLNGNSLIGNNRYITNNFNQGALVPNSYDFNSQGAFQYQGNSFDPRVGQNIQSRNNPLGSIDQPVPTNKNSPQLQTKTSNLNYAQETLTNQRNKIWFDSLNSLQQKNYLSLNKQEITNLARYQNSPTVLKSILNQQDIKSAINDPYHLDFKGFEGPETRFTSQNFEVYAPRGHAKQYAAALEHYRALYSLETNKGAELPSWNQRTTVTVQDGTNPSETITYLYGTHGKNFIGKMNVVGYDKEGILKKTLPHETVHTVLATQFGSQATIPVWVHEGISIGAEDRSGTGIFSISYSDSRLADLVKNNRITPLRAISQIDTLNRGVFNPLINQNNTRDLYSQSNSMIEYLIYKEGIANGGTRRQGLEKFYDFTFDYVHSKNLDSSLNKYYNLNTQGLEQEWKQDFIQNGYKSRGY